MFDKLVLKLRLIRQETASFRRSGSYFEDYVLNLIRIILGKPTATLISSKNRLVHARLYLERENKLANCDLTRDLHEG